jgi:carbamoyltransferase
MIRWGITANSHDAAIAVFKDNALLWAAHSERSSGVKNDRDLNDDIVQQALEYGWPSEIHWYETPWLKMIRQLYAKQYKTALTTTHLDNYMLRYGFDVGLSILDDEFVIPDLIPAKLITHRHHHSHAAAGYYTSPFQNAAVVVIDAIGEFETFTVWRGTGRKLKKLFSQSYPDSIGLWYSAMTQRIGLKPNEEEYILMGWAAIGDPNKYFDRIYSDFFEFLEPGSLKIKFKRNLHRGCLDWAHDLNTIQDYADIAAGTQAVYEHVFKHIMQEVHRKTGERNLVIMGGCALNCVANSIAYKYFDNVWIMPNPGDAGSAVGAVLAHTKQHIEWPGPYLGYEIPGDYPVEATIRELNKTGMVGVANGRAEFGPRALGNRSLLADPRGAKMKDVVNSVKQRQEFRPFAPVIMEEHVREYFHMPCDTSPYMQVVATCRHPKLFPAITHLDGTSRVQTVNAQQHPGLYKLLERWYAETGCPMLLNTSLNIKGKPMVDNEQQAAEWEKTYNVKVLTREE